jgi:acetyl-CoA carboxylase biotin carboxyl carrier protein
MDIRKVKKLIELLEQSDIAEIEIREGEESVRISRASPAGMPVYMPTPTAPSTAPLALAPPDSPPALVASGSDIPESNLVRSPMVGTFYRSPSPGSRPLLRRVPVSRSAIPSASLRR